MIVASETQWNWAGGGMSGLVRTGLRYSSVRLVAQSYGFGWNEDLLGLIRRCETFLLSQEAVREREKREAWEAEQAARERDRE